MDISKKPAGETRAPAAIRFPSPVIAKPCNGGRNPFSFKGITDSFALCVQNDRSFVIAVRVSGGHLCEAEAPTEPAGETAARCAAIRFSFKGITDSFALRVQNDRLFSHCEAVQTAVAIRFPLSNSYKQKKTACQAVF